MRKKDYAALAAILKEQRDGDAWMRDFDPTGKHAYGFERTTKIARAFANVATVDKVEFLKACGIEL